jgi:hypothetical protein
LGFGLESQIAQRHGGSVRSQGHRSAGGVAAHAAIAGGAAEQAVAAARAGAGEATRVEIGAANYDAIAFAHRAAHGQRARTGRDVDRPAHGVPARAAIPARQAVAAGAAEAAHASRVEAHGGEGEGAVVAQRQVDRAAGAGAARTAGPAACVAAICAGSAAAADARRRDEQGARHRRDTAGRSKAGRAAAAIAAIARSGSARHESGVAAQALRRDAEIAEAVGAAAELDRGGAAPAGAAVGRVTVGIAAAVSTKAVSRDGE